jgi:Flp pilus assembly protein TadG
MSRDVTAEESAVGTLREDHHRRLVRRRPDDQGSSVVEAIVVVPVIMILLTVVIQLALWAHASEVAQLAASEGNRAARSAGGSALAGVSRARAVLDGPGADVPSSRTTVTELPGGMIKTVVAGTAISLLPGVHLSVSAVVIGPVQEFRGSE